jgi:hypothetical protein
LFETASIRISHLCLPTLIEMSRLLLLGMIRGKGGWQRKKMLSD